MDKDHGLAIGGTRFFGEMSASVSHEIKNVLAIINESAGLLQDLVLMHTKQGKRLDPERLSRLSQSIQRQVTRGDRITRDLNQFAHSTDAMSERVDVVETAHFIVRLGRRLLDMKGVDIVVASESGPLTVVTNRFFLENLFWCSLSRVLENCGTGQKITIEIDGPKAAIHIQCHEIQVQPSEITSKKYFSEEKCIADFLGVDVVAEDEKKKLSLIFQS
jgi:signal transduction histidine kinase